MNVIGNLYLAAQKIKQNQKNKKKVTSKMDQNSMKWQNSLPYRFDIHELLNSRSSSS